MKLFIKNSAGSKSFTLLRSLLDDIPLQEVELCDGELELKSPLLPEQFSRLEDTLLENGFAIINDRKQIICEKIKHHVTHMIVSEEVSQDNYSAVLSKGLNLNYTYMANTFSDIEGITIEHYIIQQKILKAQELLKFSYSITEIADMLRYSNIAHFSSQFKRIIGLTPSEYKKQLEEK